MSHDAPDNTREGWLDFIASRLAPHFEAIGAPLPPNIRNSVGFPSTGRKGKRIGECWSHLASGDGYFEIFLRPDLVDPIQVTATLAHELAHAAAGLEAGHGKGFRKVAVGIGLEGKMTATTAGPRFIEIITPILEEAGPLPHGELNIGGSTSNTPKKQTSRMIKCECATCGYTVRAARKWIEEVGAPHCPAHGEMVAALPDAEEDEGEGAE